MERARSILRSLWPFMRELPENIAAVQVRVPERMQAARQLLSQLADGERHYQNLFKYQFVLAHLDFESVDRAPIPPATRELCQAMAQTCRLGTFTEGIQAIVAAELAATMYCRVSLPSYERCFEKANHPEVLEEGLAWLRLHAKTHTRHAIWMKRMLCEIEDTSGTEIPEAAEHVLSSVLKLWECPPEESKLPIPCAADVI